ncbi:transcription elongation GreA/GreB family factor [Mesoflavibacter sabulilitoris]|uniref:3-oxoacyl-ACP synthase n=1 Tax=Mesoflavibacter zeaxanthinifaciens subsp. sabulilitoris TaxID=1520893 RepID=A0A2T1N6P6_9FLAO|nr:3-oxoacyl-ACP synthase [Mesoflavibacter zeaxanthinifaciens]MBB3123104.1 transcription elongation GreA/GreB family factor [Mesoflavibacter zeaxanthinifaciens subsp. sabulilitoris]PSG87252.1 3-oxoacyl-ACP synthase [Mesoflavibacter zeaxanthinifaciens subsp. sabulilitoris]
MKTQNIKTQLLQLCNQSLETRLQSVLAVIEDIKQSLQSETKSSAGDKHETGRAMLQLEREKAGHQLAEIEKTKQILSKINTESTYKKIGLGSVVYTTTSNYFISISAGELIVEDDMFYAISANTPIGQLLLGKSVDDVINFRNLEFKITKVL